MKKHVLHVIPLILLMATALPMRSLAQVSNCEGLSLVVEWGCLGESSGWAAIDQMNGFNPPTSILWSTGATVQFITDLPSGDHWVTVTDADGCWVKQEFTVDCEKDCELEIVVEWGCLGEDLGWAAVDQILNATNPTSILWSTGATTQYVSDLASGDYWVMVTDAEECWVKYDFTIDCEKDCELEIVVEWGCVAEGIGWAVVDQILNATNPTSILWSTGATTQFVSDLASGDYWVMVTDAEECWVKHDFTIDCDKDCELRTQTPGGWGAPASGNNPGAYRDANFAGAFPGGLTIGCTNTLTLTSAAAVQAFLPSGGQPQALPAGNVVNPTSSYGSLASHLVALTLSVGFDAYDPDFGGGGSLADAVIITGMFTGWTVQELLDEANSFIGGCGSSYTASQLTSGLALVNENFVDGTTNNGNVECAEGVYRTIERTPVVTASVYPVPANDLLNMELTTTAAGTFSFLLMDATGRQVMTQGNQALDAGEQRLITFDVGALVNGIYLLTVIRDGELVRTERVIVAH
jgi:hypothetical protein